MRRLASGAPSTSSCLVSAGAVWRPVTLRGPAPCPPAGGEHACAGWREDLVERERAGSEWGLGKGIVSREGMTHDREDVYLCRG
jgi:hypothetical protein